MDLNWCTVCGRHTSGDLYCSNICLQQDGGTPLDDELGPTPEPSLAADELLVSGRRTPTGRYGDRAIGMAAAWGLAGGGSAAWAEPASPRSPGGGSGGGSTSSSCGSSWASPTASYFPSLMATARGRSPPASLLDEIRQYHFNRQHRTLPRRRGLPFWEELRAERLEERRRVDAAGLAVRQAQQGNGRPWY